MITTDYYFEEKCSIWKFYRPMHHEYIDYHHAAALCSYETVDGSNSCFYSLILMKKQTPIVLEGFVYSAF